jgi:hypothetical protein
LLTHGLGDLALQLAEDRLDGLTDLLLKGYPQVLIRLSGLSLTAILLGGAATGFPLISLPRPAILPPALGLPFASIPLGFALAVASSGLSRWAVLLGLPLPRLASWLLLVVRLPGSPRLLDGHHASLLNGRSCDRYLVPHPLLRLDPQRIRPSRRTPRLR